jgi:hypothetical protein
MKKSYLFKNIGRLSIAIGLLATAMLSSCLKDTSPGTINFGNSPALVGFQYYGFAATPLTTKVHGTANDTTDVEVTLSVKTITLKTPVTVKVALDDADAQAYAAGETASGDTTYVVPDADLSLANDGALTIQPGQQVVKLKVSIKGNLLSFAHTPVFGLKITGASGAIVATNLNVAICSITLQSVYEGDYTDNGFDLRLVGGVQDPVNGGNFKGYDSPLPTVSQYAVGFTVLWANDTDAAGVGGTYITVNPTTNAVTMAATGNATLTNAPGYNNHYDPATKTFYISFVWNTPGTRASTDTLIYQHPL